MGAVYRKPPMGERAPLHECPAVASAPFSRQCRAMAHLLSFGHGFSARALARSLLWRGWNVTGTTRSMEKVATLAAEGVTSVLWPGGDLRPHIAEATHVLVSVPPSAGGDPVLAEWRGILTEQAQRIEWLGYLSTTGVYGDRHGGWVDETDPLAPTTGRGRARVRAETAWREFASESGLPLHIFRLAGIYGPGRGPLAKLRTGKARRIIKPGQVFSRIHVDDIARVLLASIDRPNSGAVYNVCDDLPVPPQVVIAHAAGLLGMVPPSDEDFATADMTPVARGFYAESKRVRNRRIKDELGVKLKYPTYREGLAALLRAEGEGA